MDNSLLLFSIGDYYESCQLMSEDIMKAFASLSGDDNPIHLDDTFACAHGFYGRIAYGNLLGVMVSKLVGDGLPTKEVIILRQSIEFRQPAYINDKVRLVAEVASIHEAVRSVQLKLQFYTAQPAAIASGQCLIKCL